MSDLLQKAALSGIYGGISLQLPPAAVGAIHFMYDEAGKFSASLEMFNHDPNAMLREPPGKDAAQMTLRAPMLALRSPDPALGLPPGTVLHPTILVRNTTNKRTAFSVVLDWHGPSGRGQATLPVMQLAPFATEQLPIGAMQEQLGVPDDAHWALVSLTTNAAPDDLIAVASSRDATGRHGVEAKFIGGTSGHFAGGEWPADANHNTIAAITNIGSKPAEALLTLHYDGGKQKFELQRTIAPGDQDVGEPGPAHPPAHSGSHGQRAARGCVYRDLRLAGSDSGRARINRECSGREQHLRISGLAGGCEMLR
jgi:hypothetical protein